MTLGKMLLNWPVQSGILTPVLILARSTVSTMLISHLYTCTEHSISAKRKLTNTDFGPSMQTEGAGYKILKLYDNISSFGTTFFWGWRVNIFCPSQDQDLWRSCKEGHFAFEWDTLCQDGRCPCKVRNDDGSCKKVDDLNWSVQDPYNSYINIQFCDKFWDITEPLDAVIEKGKKA